MRLNLFLQLFTATKHKNGNLHLGHAQHARDFGILVAFEETQRENFGCARAQRRKRPAEDVAQLTRVVLRGCFFVERDILGVTPVADHVERLVDGRAPEVALLIFKGLGGVAAPDEAKKYLLEHIFGIGGISRDPIRCAEDEAMAFLEDSFNDTGCRGCVYLSDREFQGAPPSNLTTKDQARG